MRFLDTRQSEVSCSAQQAILSGTTPSGGLWVPETFPFFDPPHGGASNPYFMEWGPILLGSFFPEIPLGQMQAFFHQAYTQRFDHPDIVPLAPLEENTFLAELFHGPTLAFKDIALSLLPLLMTRALSRLPDFDQILLVTATSGDTGKAALRAFANVPSTRIVVLFPAGGVSTMQERMMLAEKAPNTMVLKVEGSFDHAQQALKHLMANTSWRQALAKKGVLLSTANSINVGRILAQTVYYFSSYAQLVERQIVPQGDRVHFAVPTGNFGDMLAGYYAFRMGLPVGKLLCASNQNHVLADFFQTGVYDINGHSPLKKTLSPSMDILMASNLERWLFEALDRDSSQTRNKMQTLQDTGIMRLEPMQAPNLDLFHSGFCTDAQTLSRIRGVFQQRNMLVDPHTAVALQVLYQYRKGSGDQTPCIVLSTASPFKFPNAMARALSWNLPSDEPFEVLDRLSTVWSRPLPEEIQRLRGEKSREVPAVSVAQAMETIQEWQLQEPQA
ncbi:MAG TPA: threonine synthase [Thermotogota bacterium]|nr:threonine synthase [Thermotogota bacterium]